MNSGRGWVVGGMYEFHKLFKQVPKCKENILLVLLVDTCPLFDARVSSRKIGNLRTSIMNSSIALLFIIAVHNSLLSYTKRVIIISFPVYKSERYYACILTRQCHTKKKFLLLIWICTWCFLIFILSTYCTFRTRQNMLIIRTQ